MLSLIYKEEFTHRFNVLPDPLGRALAAAHRAVEGSHRRTILRLHALASVEFFRKEMDAFRIATERAVALNPMDGFTLAYLGFLTAYGGDWERGGRLSAKARTLNPHHPGWYWFVPCSMRIARTITILNGIRAQGEYAGLLADQLALAANAGQLGQSELASEALRKLLMQRPDIAKHPQQELGVWWEAEMVERLMDGLRKAGLEVQGHRPG